MKSQDVFSPNCQIETFVLYNCSRKAPDIQGFFPMLRTAFLLCCYKHTLFSRFPHSIYRRQSSSRRGHTRRLFCCPKYFEMRYAQERTYYENNLLFLSRYSQSWPRSSKPKMKRVCWMTLKCSAEPKCRDVAQIAVFEAESVPLWLKDKIRPKGQESDFQYRVA